MEENTQATNDSECFAAATKECGSECGKMSVKMVPRFGLQRMQVDNE